MRRDATKLGPMPPQEPFNLVFLDPPYGRDLAPRALVSLKEGAWLTDGALCVIEEEADAQVELPRGFTMLDKRETGDTQVVFARFSA
jgi:16S rRNA (guanine966-N2)-methyltransferase